ncbi:MAG: type VI secretion system accessory protein TagJ [Pseudomonadota bacterium]
MTAEERLKAGDIDGALSALQDKVRKDPADPKLRIFLFQLLSVMGNWSRAITQLKVSAEMEPLAIPMAQTYREGIICEGYRAKVFAGEKSPVIFGEEAAWIAPMIEALALQAAGNVEAAAALRAQAFDAAPAVAGALNDVPFAWIADADMRLGPLLEMVINGKYYWVPFSALSSVRAEAPEDLRDSVWMPVNLTLATGAEMVGLIPTRYAGTAENGSAEERLARQTTWADAGAETFIGLGQRLLATDAGDVAIMDLRRLEFGPATAAADG